MEPRQREAYLRKLDHNGTWIMCMLRMDDLCFHSWWYVWISRPLTRHFWGSAMERQTQATPPFHLCNFIQREGLAGGLWPFVPKIRKGFCIGLFYYMLLINNNQLILYNMFYWLQIKERENFEGQPINISFSVCAMTGPAWNWGTGPSHSFMQRVDVMLRLQMRCRRHKRS